MAEIVSDQPQQPEQIPYITEEIAGAAGYVNTAANDFLMSTKPNENIPYVKALRDSVESAIPAVYPVKTGAPTEPYIQGLLKTRKQLEQFDESLDAKKSSIKPEDKDAVTSAVNSYQRFTMGFMLVLMEFEEGLPANERW